MVEPDIATVTYVYENRIHIGYYDFLSKNYSKEDKSEVAYFWPETQLANMISKPDTEVVKEYFTNSEKQLAVEVWGIDFEEYEKYKASCIKKGFDVESSGYDEYYKAKNAAGYELRLSYDNEEYTLTISLSTPEEG